MVFTKFEHENSIQFKTADLQLVRHFEVDLNGKDPFFIEGQEDIVQMQKDAIKAKQTENPYHQSSIYQKNEPVVVEVPALRYK